MGTDQQGLQAPPPEVWAVGKPQQRCEGDSLPGAGSPQEHHSNNLMNQEQAANEIENQKIDDEVRKFEMLNA